MGIKNTNYDEIREINVFTDGGARGNPGPSALGVFIESKEGEVLSEIGQSLGITTNNLAEYSAILAGLSWIIENKNKMPRISRLNFFMDSQLAVQQLNGIYKIKNSKIRELIFLIKQKEVEIGLPIYYSHVPREQNKKADRLVNLALDGKL